jgi:hypothetical protein
MIWVTGRFSEQGELVASLYQLAGGAPCERKGIMARGCAAATRPAHCGGNRFT